MINKLDDKESSFSIKELEFSLFCIDFVAKELNLSPDDVYQKLKQSGILQDYIIDNYEMLHTLSREYLVQDIVQLMQERGVL